MNVSFRAGLASLATVLLVGCESVPDVPPSVHIVEYRNGLWFNGATFDKRTWYTVGEKLASHRPRRVDEVVDLRQRYVVPPYAEGHNHWLEPRAIAAYVQSYLRDGVFYLKDQAGAPFLSTLLDSALNKPSTVDFIGANQGFTGPGGHPIQIALQFLAFGSFPKEWKSSDLEGNVYFEVDSIADIERAWPRFLAGKPDFVKVFLLYSEEYERRRKDSAFVFRRGIDPALVPGIVSRAHDAGLAVSAHVYTGADFHNAVSAGVDAIAHLPGTGYDSTMGPAAFRIGESDAALAASRSVTVTTTVSWLAELDSVSRARIVRDVVRPNLELLKRNGVQLLVGSDQFRATPAQEADILASLGVFTNAELLRLWSMDTPRSIFPRRMIGRLADDYEASFLVLDANPMDSFANAHRIVMRVKQGLRLPTLTLVDFPTLQD